MNEQAKTEHEEYTVETPDEIVVKIDFDAMLATLDLSDREIMYYSSREIFLALIRDRLTEEYPTAKIDIRLWRLTIGWYEIGVYGNCWDTGNHVLNLIKDIKEREFWLREY